MNADEYAAEQATISAAVARYVMQLAKLFERPQLQFKEWLTLLELLFPEIQRQRLRSAQLAREFYDFQRALNHPDLPRHDQFLVEYDFEEFITDMEPARQRISREDAPSDATGGVALQAVRAVELAGRKQIIRAVQQESEPRVLRGWARVATGRETCAWCLMLVSRGPVYYGADTAGLDLDDETAIRMIAAGEDVSEFMQEWHIGCDCKVIPVFKKEDWKGRTAAKRALDEWNDATKTAKILQKLDPNRVHLAGENKGKPFTLNELVINELRRRLSAGEITAADFAGLAA